jgi:sulfatase modifying factor 1
LLADVPSGKLLPTERFQMAWTANAMLLTVMFGASARTIAQSPPNYGFEWVTVGAPGNRPANPGEAPFNYPPFSQQPMLAGAVNYEYRIARTEVTVGQWLEFLNAYWPHAQVPYNHPSLTGFWIQTTSNTPGQNPGYHAVEGAANRATNTSWHMAARFVNWMHNGGIGEGWAFESGVYDTSTFTQNPDGSWNDQLTRSPGSRYWIPSLDEWVKAAYYDPNKNGPGSEGYWLYPHSSDSPPVPGWPEQGGETSAGLEPFSGPFLDVGSYSWSVSPWGLLDGSGSEREWTEFMTADRRTRLVKSQRAFGTLPEHFDRLDVELGAGPWNVANGFRIASAIPGAPSACLFMIASPVLARRRR